MNEYLVITWAESVPAGDGLADAARDRDGQLLAAGPVHDASELDSRPATTRARMTSSAARRGDRAVTGKRPQGSRGPGHSTGHGSAPSGGGRHPQCQSRPGISSSRRQPGLPRAVKHRSAPTDIR